MHKYLRRLAWIIIATFIGVGAEANSGASGEKPGDQGPTLGATKDWLKDHEKDFTSSFSFSNDSHKSFIMTIQKVEFVLRKYDPDDTPAPGCTVHFYANIHINEYDSDNNGGAIATFRAEDVSDVVGVRELDQKDLGPAAQNFDAKSCYCLIITPKDPNSDAIEMANLGVPFLEQHKLPYIAIPVTNRAMAQRLAKALHRGIQLIQAQVAAKPEPF